MFARPADIERDPKEFVVYSYKEAVSPHLAARRKGEQIELEPIRELFEKTEEEYELVIAEGSGGILCPLCLEQRKRVDAGRCHSYDEASCYCCSRCRPWDN